MLLLQNNVSTVTGQLAQDFCPNKQHGVSAAIVGALPRVRARLRGCPCCALLGLVAVAAGLPWGRTALGPGLRCLLALAGTALAPEACEALGPLASELVVAPAVVSGLALDLLGAALAGGFPAGSTGAQP